jgi:aspartate/methionine/tyrosine aminotransferase
MNPRVVEIQGSLIRTIAAKKRQTSIDLGLGEPSLLPNMEHFEAAMTFVRERGARYTANAGDPDLRARIAEYYAYPGMAKAENVCVTVGSQEAMYAALVALLDPARDELLVVEPTFPSYLKMAALGGVATRTAAMTQDEAFAIDGERIAAAVTDRTRAIVLCSPCNPTAQTISREQADVLVRALEKRGGEIALVHDEIYREQRFGERVDLARLYGNTIAINSLSKSNALTGLRLGWILGPAAFVEQATKVHAWAVSCADSFAQRVALHVFQSGAVDEHAAWYATRREAVQRLLASSGLRFVAPQGAFYALVRLPDGASSLAGALELAERYDVIAIPGIAFGPSCEGWLRISWVAPLDAVRTGLERIAEYCAGSHSAGSASGD